MLSGLRLASRKLIKTPGFAATALATLALCLGANLTIYAVVDAILVRSLPFAHPERLITMINSYPAAGVERSSSSTPNYYDRRVALKSYTSLAISQPAASIIGKEGSPTRVDDMRVSPEFFSTLGVPLLMGRSFTDAEMTYDTDGVAVISDSFWQSEFAGDANVIGKTFLSNGTAVTVIGVLPKDFSYLSNHAQFYRPASSGPNERTPTERHSNNWEMIARLAPGATLASAQAEVNSFNAKQLTDDPFKALIKTSGYHTDVRPLQEDHVREVKPMLLLLQCGGLLLLLIGGVNLANLLLIRASARTKELAVRKALGASPFHVAMDVLQETLLLSVCGGLLGLLVGAAGIRLLGALGTNQLPLGSTIRFDGRVALASLAASALVGIGLAVPIIWFNANSKLLQGLQSEGRGGTSGKAAQSLRSIFIVAQVALAFILLSGAGLLGLSLKKVMETPPGFRADNILTASIGLPWKAYPDHDSHVRFIKKLLPAMRALPGVTGVAINDGIPFTGAGNDSAVSVEGADKEGVSIRAHYLRSVTSDYWSIMGISLLQGRLIDDWESARDLNVCVVDQAFAERYWPGKSPLGHRLTNGPNFDPKNCATIVGVVANVKERELSETDGHGVVYFNAALFGPNGFYLIVGTALPPSSLTGSVRKTLLTLDPGLPLDDVHTLQSRIDDTLVARRSPAVLAGIFSAVALLLAAIGTYGVLAYAVGQRKREIGVRMALGAQPGQVLSLFLGFGATLLAIGIVIGVVGAWLSGRAMQKVLFGVDPLSPSVLAASTAIMVVVVFFAILLPSRRAAGINPIEALRDD
ncbi:MAG TPA: ADOP family duplicated permease [Opitutaceae bacterium]|jgi:predicted permease|nr:ADOP family duplicated permease [Opitutaceae bacterium]